MSFIICKLAVQDGRSLVHYMQSNMQWTVDERKAFIVPTDIAAEQLVSEIDGELECWVEEI